MPPQRLAPVPVRCFAASTKPAIQLFGVSGRYATALYQVAAEKGALADVEAELTGIAALRDSSPQFANFMDDPTLSVSQRTDTMDAIMAKGGYSETTAKFFGVVIENRRLPDLAKITDDFLKLTAAGKFPSLHPNALVPVCGKVVEKRRKQTESGRLVLGCRPVGADGDGDGGGQGDPQADGRAPEGALRPPGDRQGQRGATAIWAPARENVVNK